MRRHCIIKIPYPLEQELWLAKLTLEDLRRKAFFQNTVDVWIMSCEERGDDWWDIAGYRAFIDYLHRSGVKMQKFPLCIKESGGVYERGRDKTRFFEQLSQLSSDDASAYTIKLSDSLLKTIRSFRSLKQ